MNNNEKQLLAYMSNTLKNLFIGVVFLLLGIVGILGLIALISLSNLRRIKIGIFILPVVFIFVGFSFIKDEPRKRKNIKDLLKTAAGQEMILDFSNTKKYLSDRFRLGRKFLFVKDKETPVVISEIKIIGVSQRQDSSYSLSVFMEDGSVAELRRFSQSEYNKNKKEIDAFLKEFTILNSEIVIKA